MLILHDIPRIWKIRKEWLFYSEDQYVDKNLFSVLTLTISFWSFWFYILIWCLHSASGRGVKGREGGERERQTDRGRLFHCEEFNLNWYCANICKTVLEFNPLFGNNFLHVLKLQKWHEAIIQQRYREHLAVWQTVYGCMQILLCWRVKFKTCKPRVGICSFLLHTLFIFFHTTQ
jgi:hypothetical protein